LHHILYYIGDYILIKNIIKLWFFNRDKVLVLFCEQLQYYNQIQIQRRLSYRMIII